MQINREKNVETFILCRKKNPAFVHNYRKSDRTRQKCAEDWISEKNCKTPLTNPEKSVILVKQSTFTDNGGLDMAKDLRIILLLDCYGAFLTPRQQEMMTHYYSEDLSLGEIAALTGTTRQAVRDSVKRSEQVLNDMEEKLQFAEKLCALRQNYAAIARTAETLAASRAEPAVQHACAAICSCVKAGLELL